MKNIKQLFQYIKYAHFYLIDLYKTSNFNKKLFYYKKCGIL